MPRVRISLLLNIYICDSIVKHIHERIPPAIHSERSDIAYDLTLVGTQC